jgi:Metallopeptidase family M24
VRAPLPRRGHAVRDGRPPLRGAAALAAVRPGISAAALDRVCPDALRAAGLGGLFHHRTGYSIGLGLSNWIEDLR